MEFASIFDSINDTYQNICDTGVWILSFFSSKNSSEWKKIQFLKSKDHIIIGYINGSYQNYTHLFIYPQLNKPLVEHINENFFPLDMNIKIQIIRFILTLYNRKKLDDFLYSNTIVFQNEKNEIALILPCPAYTGAKIILLNKLDDECLDYPDFDILKTNKIPSKSSRKVN